MARITVNWQALEQAAKLCAQLPPSLTCPVFGTWKLKVARAMSPYVELPPRQPTRALQAAADTQHRQQCGTVFTSFLDAVNRYRTRANAPPLQPLTEAELDDSPVLENNMLRLDIQDWRYLLGDRIDQLTSPLSLEIRAGEVLARWTAEARFHGYATDAARLFARRVFAHVIDDAAKYRVSSHNCDEELALCATT